MKKRIGAMFLILMIIALHRTAVPVHGAGAVITVETDRTEVVPGDIITCTLVLGPVQALGTLQMVLDIPEGLTYVPGSGSIPDGLQRTLGFDALSFTEVSGMINGVASAGDYACDSETVLGTFQVTVDAGFSGTVVIGLKDLEFYSCETWEDHSDEYTVVGAVIAVESASGETAGSAEKSDPQPDEPDGNDKETVLPATSEAKDPEDMASPDEADGGDEEVPAEPDTSDGEKESEAAGRENGVPVRDTDRAGTDDDTVPEDRRQISWWVFGGCIGTAAVLSGVVCILVLQNRRGQDG